MARIRVYRDETDGGEFPRHCARCGSEADTDRAHTFSWVPEWVLIIILGGLLPWLIVTAILRKTMRVTLPLCHRHRNHWLNRQLFLWLGLLWWIGYAIALGVTAKELPKDALNAGLAVLIFGGLLWLLVGLFYVNSGIKAKKISDRWIDLVGIDPEFAREWEASLPPPVAPVVRRPKRQDVEESPAP
jgi:hypothetical protein